MYNYCLGYVLDGNYCEKTCKKRDNCRYYDENIYAHYKHIWSEMDFLMCYEPCQYYLPIKEDEDICMSEEVDPFAAFMQHDMK